MADSFGGVPQLTFPAADEAPDPLHVIAGRLFPLVRSCPDWWREAVRRWASDPPLHGDDGEGGVVPVPFPETLTPDERLAILAAIHDAYAMGVAQINPWPPDARQVEESADAIHDVYRASVRYGVLIDSRVPKLRKDWNTHEAAIEMFIAEAADTLEDKVTAGKGATPKRPGRKKADYETVRREAKLAADWERARDAGAYKADFAKQKGLKVKTLDALLTRVRKRDSRAE